MKKEQEHVYFFLKIVIIIKNINCYFCNWTEHSELKIGPFPIKVWIHRAFWWVQTAHFQSQHLNNISQRASSGNSISLWEAVS